MSITKANGESVPSMGNVLKNPDFLKLWVAQILSQTAQQILNYALILQVEEITGSSTAVAGIIISFTIPAILFAAIAGVFVERTSKKTMLVITNAARGIMVLAYLFTDASWGAATVLPIFYVVTLLFSGVSQFFNPAEASKIPLVVRREELVAANSLFNLTLTGTALGGFVLIGPLLLGTVFHDNYPGVYITIFVLCIAASALTYFLPHDVPTETMGQLVTQNGAAASTRARRMRSGMAAAWEELREGWAFIRVNTVIKSAILYWSVAIAVFMMLGTIGPGFLERVLSIDKSQLFYILLPGGIGLVVGVILVGRWSSPENRESMINRSLFLAGISLVAFALVQPVFSWLFGMIDDRPGMFDGDPPDLLLLTIMGALTFFLGLFNSFISVPAQTALQERSPEEIRARVFSAFYTVSNAILLVPVALAGAMADFLGHVLTVAIIGAVVLLIAALGIMQARRRSPMQTSPLSEEMVTPEEIEAALTVGSPAPQHIPASAQQHAHDRISDRLTEVEAEAEAR
jgi:MFS family permease